MTGCSTCTKSCLTQHPKCNAECCRSFDLVMPNDLTKIQSGQTLSLYKPCTQDIAKYYKLHGARYAHGLLTVKLDKFKVTGQTITFYRDCDYLTKDLLCKHHGTSRQPNVCKSLDINKPLSEQPKNVAVTENCIVREVV